MKKLVVGFLCLGLTGLMSDAGFALDVNDNWKMFVTNELELTFNQITGPGQRNSFLYIGNSGRSYEDRFDFLNRLTFDDVEYEFDSEFRFTNNERIDVEDASMKKLYLKRTDPYTFFQTGDFFANFSQYSLNQNLKGVAATLKEFEGNPWNVNILWGSNKSRWEYVWNDEADELKDTGYTGIRLGRKMGPLTSYFNFVYTAEGRLSDISDNTSRSTASVYHNHLWSTDWQFKPTGGLDISGESAVSRDKDSPNGIVDVGFAHQVRSRFRIKDLRSQFEFERTPSDFHTRSGSASTDRERYRWRNNYYFNNNNEVFGNFTTYRDNTQDTLTYTTKVKITELGGTVRNILNRKTLLSTIQLKERRRHRSDETLDERTSSANCIIEDRVGPFQPRVEYEIRRVNPRKDPNDSGELTQSVSWGVSSYHRNDIWTVRPSVTARFEQTDDAGAPAARGINRDWIWTGGLGGGYKRDTQFNVDYSYSEADNYNPSSDTRRKALRCSLDYSVGGNRDNVVGLVYENRLNRFSTDTSDYEENILKFKWTRRF